MPCSDSSSSIVIRLDHNEKFVHFDYAKITCGQEIGYQTGYGQYCQGKTLEEILNLSFTQIAADLKVEEEDRQFVLYLEWDCLRSAISQYLGIDDPEIDTDRCRVSEVTTDDQGIEIALVVLPPKELPKIIACGLAEKRSQSSENRTQN